MWDDVDSRLYVTWFENEKGDRCYITHIDDVFQQVSWSHKCSDAEHMTNSKAVAVCDLLHRQGHKNPNARVDWNNWWRLADETATEI
jgi:hypothetical protein